MIKILTLTISFLSLSVVSAQLVNTVKSKTSIQSITVFLTGGEITRNSKVKLKKGINELKFTGISTVIDSKSIQFSTDSPHYLVSISTEMDYITGFESNPQIKKIKDSLELISTLKSDNRNEYMAYKSEKQLLEKNNSIKGSQKNLSVEELKSMANFYRLRMLNINKKISKYDTELAKINAKFYAYNQQLSELNYEENAHSNQIIVIIDSETNQDITFELKYIVSNCGWQPNYDLSADNSKGKISLKYKAKVYNNTGNDWSNVKLTLSTSNPNISATAPILSPWYLNSHSVVNDNYKDNKILVPQKLGYAKLYNNTNAPQQNQQLDVLSLNGEGRFNFKQDGFTDRNKKKAVQIKTIDVPQLSSQFEIQKKYSIPSNSKPYLVEISEHNLEATFSHKSVPKLDKDVFLLANIVGWEKLSLVSGPTNVYFGNTFVGQSYINTRNVEDTLRLSFGRDKNVLVTRKKLDQFSTKKILGSNKKDTYTYEIVIKNNQNINLSMDLYDQIPVSQQSEISVTTNETSEANYNEDNGILKWNVTLAPGEVRICKVSFTVKYPKNKNIQVKKFRSISAPSF